MHSKLQNGTKWRQGVVFVELPRPFWSSLGTQRDPENPSRIDFLLKSAFQTYYFWRFFVQISVSLVFVQDFVSIFHKQSMKTWWKHQGIFSHHRLFFWTWRPSRNIVFYDTKATFSVFFFLYFFQKKHPKSNPKFKSHSFPQKTLKSGSGGCVLGPKMMPN